MTFCTSVAECLSVDIKFLAHLVAYFVLLLYIGTKKSITTLEEKYLRGEFSFSWDKDTTMEQENIPPEEKEPPAKKWRKAEGNVILF